MVKICLPRATGLLGALAIALAAAPAAAGTVSGAMTVSATVEESCRIDARPLVFGAMPETHGAREASSSLALACTPAASYLVTMDDGRHGDGAARRMADPAGRQFLAYNIFTDPARTRRWGASAVSGVGAVAPANGRVDLPVYARLEAGPNMPGSYSDTVTVTVEF